MVSMRNDTFSYKSTFVQLSKRIDLVAQAMRSLSVDQADYFEKMAHLQTELKLIASCSREIKVPF